uniref:NmrA-like domain-containing protein n=1 Tax=Globisporangium ultimum (strain ATCC 200006 / CBS 805.95 / DAOM BR144) TaxID=431595 RepID=K3WNN0_GLOUD
MGLYTVFAMIGAGSLGSFIATELLKTDASVKVLTRDDSKPEWDVLRQSGASIVKVDYSDEKALQEVLAGVQVVVSTVSVHGLAAQVDIAKVAKAAGAQLFVPAEFGFEITDGTGVMKTIVKDALKDMQLPYVLFQPGFFADIFHEMFGYNYVEGRMAVVGKGDKPFSTTSRHDIGRFVAHVLTTAAPSELEWNTLCFEADRLTPQEVASRAEEKLGTSIEITYLDVDEIKKNYDTDIIAFLYMLIEDGRAAAWSPEEAQATVDKYFPNWEPAKFDAFI